MPNARSYFVQALGAALILVCAVVGTPASAQSILPPGVSMPDNAQPVDEATPTDSALTIASIIEPTAADQQVGTTVLRAETPDSARVFEPVPPVWVDQPTISGVRAYEALFDARDLRTIEREDGTTYEAPTVTTEACPAAASNDLSEPAAYDRNATLLPPGQVAYFYTEPDSLVHCAVYRWDEATRMSGRDFIRLMRDGGIDPMTVLATYDVMFDEVVRSVKRRLGSPQHLDPTPTPIAEGNVSHRRTARWTTDDVVIDLRLAISRIGGHLTVVQYWQ